MKNIKDYVELEKRTNTNNWYRFKNKNAKGESITVEITECGDTEAPTSLAKLWKENGFTNKLYYTYLCVTVYVTDSEGNCWGRYNPTCKLSDDGKRQVINFNWLLDNTEDNKIKLLEEIYRLAFTETKGGF